MNSHNLNDIKRLFLVIIIVSLTNCNTKQETDKWDNVKINSNISKESIYSTLDKQEEIYGFELEDSLMKRTSDVAYFSGEKINLLDDKYSKLNNCRAQFNKSNILIINIGISNGFSGWGFTISYRNKKFYTEPYSFTDMVIPDEVEPTYQIIFQKLTLDKANYKLGDSVYGRVEFKSIETDKENKKIEHFGIGNFRTKVKRRI
jgi:hypothetical protein